MQRRAPTSTATPAEGRVYLDETPFADLKAASDAEAFTCQLCKRLEKIESQIKEQSCQACLALQTRVEELVKRVQALDEKCKQLTEQAEVDDSQGNNSTSPLLSADTPNPDQQVPGLANVVTGGLEKATPDKDLQEQVEAVQRALKSDLENAGDGGLSRAKPKATEEGKGGTDTAKAAVDMVAPKMCG
ncbi:hypothetical protein HPB50_015033 [Hyalomma asiaticum]|uniref:Uncharacterized protein n=1 Tax=Hyalomma asiaticum TaxID=266040 RepID=A0ACB7SMP3_HYAAI|nr:hypothetical protein HPB50_015033 [Hyalomma asiaticum]